MSTLVKPSRLISCLSSISKRSLALTQRTFSSETAENKEQELTENEKKLTKDLETSVKEIEDLKTKNNELLDKYKRSLADSENLRTRLTKQIDDAKVFGIQSFCKDLLEVADILGHATDAVPQEQLDSNPQLKNLFEGLQMTKACLTQTFKRHGLEQVNPINEKFNPNFHEAVFQVENDKVEANTVVVVSKLGYKLKERCIRPACVGVSK
ncbi:GRPEL1 family protein [Megaselia abdita]